MAEDRLRIGMNIFACFKACSDHFVGGRPAKSLPASRYCAREERANAFVHRP
jgi:hypothetical protein